MQIKQKAECRSCGKEMARGRSDKLYCDDICRARATRARNKLDLWNGEEDAHKALIKAIRNNYQLLKKAIGDREEWIVDIEPLGRKGFDLTLHTRSVKLSNGQTRFYCFEIGWEDLGEAKLRVTVDYDQLTVHGPSVFTTVSEPTDPNDRI